MIQCQSCHYKALGPVELTGHLMAVHGFGKQGAKAEAARVTGTRVSLPSEAVALQAQSGETQAGSPAAALHTERMDLLAAMVQELRSRNAKLEAERDALLAALNEALALTSTPEHAQDDEWYASVNRLVEFSARAAAQDGRP